MKTAIVYHSAGGNTKALAKAISCCLPQAALYTVREFDSSLLSGLDGLIVGTYTWGNGELPARSAELYQILSEADLSRLTTAVFGTGETGYRHFCGAADRFRDMLHAKSRLAVTLKIEQMYQETDLVRIEKFARLFLNRLAEK